MNWLHSISIDWIEIIFTHSHKQMIAGEKKIDCKIFLIYWMFCLVSLFNGISTFMGYLMLKTSL